MRTKMWDRVTTQFCGIVLVTLCLVAKVEAQVYVSPNGNNTSGTSWATALHDVGAAVVQAGTQHQDVWIAQGTYTVTTALSIQADMGVYGGFPATGTAGLAERKPDVFVTTLDGRNAVGNIMTCVAAHRAQISGLRMIRSTGGGDGYAAGGAVTVSGATQGMSFDHCTFESNHAPSAYGGGMRIYQSQVALTHCVFRDNISIGGGFGAHMGDFTISDCVFDNNQATGGGGGVGAYDSTAEITRCVFTNNVSPLGAGIDMHQGGAVTVSNCLFAGNQAATNGGALRFDFQVGVTIANCTIVNNSSSATGGAVMLHSNSGTIANCIFAGNATCAMVDHEVSPTSNIKNCLFFGNSKVYFNQSVGTLSAVNGPGGLNTLVPTASGNLDGDPGFKKSTAGDYHILSTSPCVDAGTSLNAPLDDLEGRVRPLDLPGVGSEGTGQGYDIGAYEYYPGPTITTNNGVSFLTNDPALTLNGTCPAGMTAVLVDASPANVTFVPGETSWSFNGALSEGANAFVVTLVYTNGSISDAAAMTITLDTIPPNAPVITAASPTDETKPTWTWVSGGNVGSGTFRYQVDGGAWSAPTSVASFAPSTAFNYGETHVLAVQERDLAGNWSSSGTRAVLIAKNGDVDDDGTVNAVDVQLVINAALGLPAPGRTDMNQDGLVNAVDVQSVINAALGLW